MTICNLQASISRANNLVYIRDCFIYPIDRFIGKTEIGFCMLSIDCVLTLQYIYIYICYMYVYIIV